MGILYTILTILDVLIAVLIIALVLVQQSKSTGLGTTFGGGGSDSLFGAHAATHLSKLTVIFSALFLVITLALAIMSGHQSQYKQGSSFLDPLLADQPAATAPVATAKSKNTVPENQKAQDLTVSKKAAASSKKTESSKKN